MNGPRNPVKAATGRAVRAAICDIESNHRCPTCGHVPLTARQIKAWLPPPFADLGEPDIRHHRRLIRRGIT